MIDARTQAILQEIIRRESRSLLQYVSDSFPWTTTKEEDMLARLQQLVKEQRQGIASLVQFLARCRLAPPPMPSYPASFTNINYIALDNLLPRLAADERLAVADLEHALPGIQHPEAWSLVQKILDMKQRHFLSLEGLSTTYPEMALP